jgi:hypothetical protein
LPDFVGFDKLTMGVRFAGQETGTSIKNERDQRPLCSISSMKWHDLLLCPSRSRRCFEFAIEGVDPFVGQVLPDPSKLIGVGVFIAGAADRQE